jgi:serine/threonine-protein kinase
MSKTSPVHYRALYELGRGGMGVVELAEAGALGLVAIKRILPERSKDGHARSEFLREARLLARIDHPNVVRVLELDPGLDGGPPALVMEHIEGLPLREVLLQGPLPAPLAASVARDLALGLHAAHELRDEQGKHLAVVHRDVSPHNVLLTFEGQVKLLDFGVAKTTEGTRTVTGEVKGKIAYMSPEQALGDPVDRRSDLHALGSLLYETLSGRRRYGEGTDLEVLRRILTETPEPLAALCPGLDPGLLAIVDRLCSTSPDDRPATAHEVAELLAPHAAPPEALGEWMQQLFPLARQARRARIAAVLQGDTSGTRGNPGSTTTLASPAPRPRMALALGLGALALGLAGVGWRLVSGGTPAPAGASSGAASVVPVSTAGLPSAPAAVSEPPSAPIAPPSVRLPPASGGRPPPRLVALPTAPVVSAAPARPVNSTRIDERPF